MNKEKKPIIYQVFPRIFGNTTTEPQPNGTLAQNGSGKFSAFTPTALQAIKKLSVTHMWYTGVVEHATQTDYALYGIPKDHPAVVKGQAGSPYAIKDYYDVAPDLADDVPNRMAEFEALVRRTHEAGMQVVIDFVPNHVARHYHSDAKPCAANDLGATDRSSLAFDPNNNYYYLPGQAVVLPGEEVAGEASYNEFPARATGNNCFSAHPSVNDWYDTVKLNYGVDYEHEQTPCFSPMPDTWKKMLAILQFWVNKGVDGFRCDMIELVPIEFWAWVIPQIKAIRPCCFIGEAYNPALYHSYIVVGKFDYLYDKVGLYDTLRRVITGHASTHGITHCWQAVEKIQTHLLYFLENHDEQRIASDFFAGSGFAGFPGMVVSATMNTNPVLLYCGQEFGERGMDNEGYSGTDGRTSIFDYWRLRCLQQWRNGNTFDGAGLDADQKRLYEAYCQLFRLVQTEPAIQKGVFFDLMYVNPQLQANGNKLYAYLRHYAKETLLFVVNFEKADRCAEVHIPADAFGFLHLPDNRAAVQTDLLTGQQGIGTLTQAAPVQLQIRAYSYTCLKFSYVID